MVVEFTPEERSAAKMNMVDGKWNNRYVDRF